MTTNKKEHKKSREALLKKARSKYLSSKLARSLLRLDSPLAKKYAQTLFCCNSIEVKDGEFKSNYYCKNRWCQNCQRMLMSKIIAKYQPQLEQLSDLYFVTLTRPTVTGDSLPNQINHMQKCWQKILNQARRDCNNFKGVKKIECKAKYRGSNNWEYHLHYHIIIEGKNNAEWLVNKWLKLNPESSSKAQDYRAINNIEAGVTELFKYFTKLTTSDNAGNETVTPAEILDVIFRALYKRRLYQPFGGLKAAAEDEIEIEPQEIIAPPGIYQWSGNDWVNTEYGNLLTGYTPQIEDIKIWQNGT